MLIDVHCHLDFLPNPKEAIINAIKNNVKIIIANSSRIESNEKVLALSKEFPEAIRRCRFPRRMVLTASQCCDIKAALGIYPIDALTLSDSQFDSQLKFIEKNKSFVSAIGEVGIDFKEDTLHHEQQITNFKKFISLAQKLNIPIIVHSRKAESLCIELLEKSEAKKVIMHYFSGSMSLVKKIISNGWFLSIPTCVTNSEHFQKVISITPIEQLFCETDSPYSHPEKLFPNEPANVLASYKKIAEIKSLPIKEVENQIENNFNKLFSILSQWKQ